jgi:CubicO group peptidase (beta-lactamase class C family)
VAHLSGSWTGEYTRATLRSLFKEVVVLLALVTVLALSADLGPVDAFVQTERDRQKVPGVAVAIVRGGEVVKAQGYGLANVEHQVAVRPETIFQSGSVGKQFTSTAVMLLVEEGKLALSDPLTRFFPEAPAPWRGITVRHLLTHTSGLPDYGPETVDYRKDYTEEELARLAFGLKLEFAPDSGRPYPYGFGWGVEETAGQAVHRHGVAWQGFTSAIARFLGSDLTVVVLANLAEADPTRFVDGIASLLDSRLAKPELAPIADTEPKVTDRLRELLAAAAQGKLEPGDFAYVRAGFFPQGADQLRQALGSLGPPTALRPLERRDLGDDRVHTYDVDYGSKPFRAVLALAPDGKVAQLSVRPR